MITARVGKRAGTAFWTFLLIVLTVAFNIPIIWMFLASLKTNLEIFAVPPRWLPQQATLEAYQKILGNREHLQYFINSYLISLIVVLVSLIFASLAGYGFSRFRFRGSQVLLLFILVLQMFPGVVLSIPYFNIMTTLNLYDTYPALIIAYSSFALPFSAWMLRSYFDSIPRELEEAAMVDGSTRIGALFRIILPLSAPGILATGVYAFLLAWNELLFALTLTNSWQVRPVTVGIAMLIGQYSNQWNALMAISVIASIPLVIFFIFLQRYLVHGLTQGAIK